MKRIQSRAQARHDLHQAEHQRQQVFIDTLTAAERIGYRIDPTDRKSATRARSAFRVWAKRHGIVCLQRGSRVVVSWLDVEAELRRKAVA